MSGGPHAPRVHPRDAEIAILHAMGQSPNQIAGRLGIAVTTVVRRIYALGFRPCPTNPAAQAALRAHSEAFLNTRRRERELADRRDSEIAALHAKGWSQARIAGRLNMAPTTVARRIQALELPPRPAGFQHHHAGLSEAQMDVYRLYAGKRFRASEARQVALQGTI